jgi:hypothetical protein
MIVDNSSGKTTLNVLRSLDKIPMWNVVEQTKNPTRAAETGLLAYDNTDQQYKRLPDASDPAPYPVKLHGSYPELRCLSTETKPTVNTDGSDLVNYQTLLIMDTGEIDYWDGTDWQVFS